MPWRCILFLARLIYKGSASWVKLSADDIVKYFFLIFPRNKDLTFHVKNNKKKSHLSSAELLHITKTCLFNYTENFTTKKWKKKSDKKLTFFHISAQNIDCGYSLEPPRRGGSNEYPQSMFLSRNKKNNIYPSKPQFYYTKVGFKEVNIT